MSKDEVYTQRILEIHSGTHAKEPQMDIRHEEFTAMADAYLGPGFDREKLAEVERIQVRMQEGQVLLTADFDAQRISGEQYVNACNQLVQDSTAMCARVLGPEHFKTLFGVEAGEAVAIIDKAAFLSAHGDGQRKDYSDHYAAVTTRFL